MSPLIIWTNFRVSQDQLSRFRQAVSPHELLIAPDGGSDPRLTRAHIAYGQPDLQQVIESQTLRWIQISSAGYTRYDRQDVRQALHARGAVMTNSSGVFDEPCAQHLLAMMLAMTRQLPQALDNQRAARSWTVDQIRAQSRLLRGQKVLLVGYGAIARRLVQMLAPFQVEVIGIRRTARGDEPIVIDSVERLPERLAWADHIVNILPLSDSTQAFFDASKFAMMKPGAMFYNIGRGKTVDQVALCEALQRGPLAAAYLDVTTPEPLPPDDLLWTLPNCFITPHTGGGHHNERDRQIDHFVKNLRRFESGAPLLDRVM